MQMRHKLHFTPETPYVIFFKPTKIPYFKKCAIFGRTIFSDHILKHFCYITIDRENVL